MLNAGNLLDIQVLQLQSRLSSSDRANALWTWYAIQSFGDHECLLCHAARAVVKDIIFAEECWPSAEGCQPGCAEKHVQHSEAGRAGFVWPSGLLLKLAPCRLAYRDQNEAINADMLYSLHHTVRTLITGRDNKKHVASFEN